MMSCCPKAKCLWLPRPIGAALGLITILVAVGIQLSFLSIQLVQGIVMAIAMPLAPLSLSWIVNHLYATPIGRVHVWAFQLFRRCFADGPHSGSIRLDFVTEPYSPVGSTSTTAATTRAEDAPRMVVHTVACLMDNYCYLLVDHTGEPPYAVAAVDPADPFAVLAALREIAVTQYGGRGLPNEADGASGGGDDRGGRGRGGQFEEEREFEDVHDAAAAANSEVGANPVAAPMLSPKKKKRSGGSRGSRGSAGSGDGARAAASADGFSDVLRLECILTTHRHWDHAYGNPILKRLVPSLTRVYGGREDGVPGETHPLDDGDVVRVGSLAVRAIATPCHTRGSLCYQVQGLGGTRDALFTGDTLFTGGCGAPFEGDAEEMYRCFQRIWLESAPKTLLFPGHEYGEALLPEYFKAQSASFPLPGHPDDYAKLTNQYWRTHRNRRYHLPPLPSVPMALEAEMSYNAYFAALHAAADAVGVVMRRQRMAYPEVAARRARGRRRQPSALGFGGSLSAAGRGGGRGGGAGSASGGRGSGGGSSGSSGGSSDDLLGDALPCPPGLDPEVWSVMTPMMKQEMLQELHVQYELLQAQYGNRNNGSSSPAPSSSSSSSSSSVSATLNPALTQASSEELEAKQSQGGGSSSGNGGGGDNTVGGAPSGTEDDEGQGGSGATEDGSGSSSGGGGGESSDEGDAPSAPPPPPSQQGSPVVTEERAAAGGSGGGDVVDESKNSSSSGSSSSSSSSAMASRTKGGGPSQAMEEEKPDTSQDGWSLLSVQQEGLRRESIHKSRPDSKGYVSPSRAGAGVVDHGAYAVEVTMDTLIESLQALCAGGDRIRVRDLYRALTTLGNTNYRAAAASSSPMNGFGNNGSSGGSGGGGGDDVVEWRGMPDGDARELIDMMNLPQTVLATPYEDFHRSEESIVVEYAASLFSGVCDNSPDVPPSGFLACCRTCKLCPPASSGAQVGSDGSDVSDGSSSSASSSSSSSGPAGNDSAFDIANAMPDSRVADSDTDTVILRSGSTDPPNARTPRGRVSEVELPRAKHRADSTGTVVSGSM